MPTFNNITIFSDTDGYHIDYGADENCLDARGRAYQYYCDALIAAAEDEAANDELIAQAQKAEALLQDPRELPEDAVENWENNEEVYHALHLYADRVLQAD